MPLTSKLTDGRPRTMRRLYLSLLLPVFLLFMQQGALRHEVGHLAQPSKSCPKESPTSQDPCSLCLAFGHLTGAATPRIAALQLTTGLSFAFDKVAFSAGASLPAPKPRSRGPPAS